ncbi:ABC transporter permease [Olivibacter sp. XZL3]|uniref:ABC transporter permease n=1 Tax=Olivibacter sp. XZL3 TaxID=1735116 RepID=UPI001066CDE7|nr:ABC transporter permease [Olivibacter sp. XZL3]
MLQNSLLTALRYFWKNKITTLINILGLAIGISASLVIYIIIRNEYSYEKDVPNKEHVYRVVTDGEWKNSGIRVPLARAIKEQVSGIEAVSQIYFDGFGNTVRVPINNEKQPKLFKKEKNIAFIDTGFFHIFPHRWVVGNPAQALSSPHQVVLTESKMRTFFPGINAQEVIGKVIIFKDSLAASVSGIVKDREINSDFRPDIFISLTTIPHEPSLKALTAWDEWNNTNSSSQCVVILNPNTSVKKVNQQIETIFKKNNKEEDEDGDFHRLQPIQDIHFNPAFSGQNPTIEKSTLRNLSILAVFLVLLGAINFINLSTAQSVERAKEIGIRKTLGGARTQLVSQFLLETFLITAAAGLLSVLISPLIFQAFSSFVPRSWSFADLLDGQILSFLLAIIIVVAFLAGLYPSWVLTSFNPVTALKNQVASNSSQTRSAWVRKSLTVFQFVIAQVFLICVLVVSKQINFSKNKDMGFRKDAVINFYIPDFLDQKSRKKFVLFNELKNIPEIEAVSLGNQSPAFSGSMSMGTSFMRGDEKVETNIDTRTGDDHFLEVYRIPLVAGRNVVATDSIKELLVNESMVKFMGLKSPQEALGKILNDEWTIVGIMKDFNIASVRSPIKPLTYRNQQDGFVMHIALRSADPSSWKAALSKMEKAWHRIYPDNDFDYTFLDKTIENFYRNDLRLSRLLNWASGLAIFIAGMGLFGLGVFTANQRTKEIGIRKVLGAEIVQIMVLLIKNLAALVLLACFIAFPIAAYFMHNWLNDFAFKTELSWWIFALSGTGMLLVAIAVLGIKAYRAAIVNPVESLRSE